MDNRRLYQHRSSLSRFLRHKDSTDTRSLDIGTWSAYSVLSDLPG